MSTFHYSGSSFYFNNEPIQIISGAIHHFRVVPEYWKDRLLKLKACGFNTVETYVAWNIHEPQKGQFNFEGIADLIRFIEIAGKIGLHVIVRPSPYICAEWEFGGMPAWLLAEPDMWLRCYHKPFLEHVDAYYDVLLPKLRPLLCTQGGPIIAMQIENEYGSYGNDKPYLNYLKDAMIKRGIDVLLFTSDGPEDYMLQGGMVDGVLATVNFGSRPAEAFAKLRKYQPDAPIMCMEFWNGWFDHWREGHHTRPAQDVAEVLDEMLSMGASVNFYMFHGGTNFGFYNGANGHTEDSYEPTITSYDYDVLLDESGEPTNKYYAVRDVIAKHQKLADIELPQPLAKQAYGEVAMTGQAPLSLNISRISQPIQSAYPVPMEKLGQDYGFIQYSTFLSGSRPKQPLNIQDLHDRALVFLDGRILGTLDRSQPGAIIEFEVPESGAHLSILVENMGRVNYGPYIKDLKGVTEGVRHGMQFLSDWTIHPLPLSDLSGLLFEPISSHMEPSFYRGELTVNGVADTFLSLDGWIKGVVFLNGFNLGRYWNVGPQRTLYVPGPLLREGSNEIIIFELHGAAAPRIRFVDKPDLG
ncbi:beta-galactosidase [Paenibacillus motobuensis]|uniref:glycoside hydrolase family 35 protein n=1 Tax=Paenibacillus TaxID=44249 RepID=UPI00203A7F37|nr:MULTISPECIES: beta-galactosidase family protein [Paenibacillus]MCM3042058.1 beta-galactosidase [Paenibacillus lutimineralis]MCM3649162.1 beta-galactosidase [Paenibacillus motobuensis]